MNNLFLKILIVPALLLTACENDINEVRSLTEKRIYKEEGKKIESYLSENGKVKAKLTSPVMYRQEADTPYIEFPQTLHVDFYNEAMQVESQLNAHYARYKENENKVFLKDSIQIFNTLGDTLWCMELWWDQKAEKFYTDKPVRLYKKSDDLISFGDNGLEATQDLKTRTFLKGHGTVMVNNDSIP